MTIPSLFKNRPFCLCHSLEGCLIVDNLGISINKAVYVCIRMCVVLTLDDFLKFLLGISQPECFFCWCVSSDHCCAGAWLTIVHLPKAAPAACCSQWCHVLFKCSMVCNPSAAAVRKVQQCKLS